MKFTFESVTFILSVALASLPAAARPLPQDGIAVARNSQGQLVFVNADSAPAAFSAVTLATTLQPSPKIRQLIGETACSLQVDPKLVDAVMRVESGYQPDARSPKGALGLMQLIPATAARFGVQNPLDAAENVRGGVTYLGELLKTFNGDVPLTLAAYNAGEGAVLRHGGIPPFAETRDYVRKVTALYPPALSHTLPCGGASRGSSAAGSSGLPLKGDLAALDEDRGIGARAGGDNPVSPVPVYRYVDSEGRIHFAQ